ncbi:hypothetical protein ACFVYJ_03015 [Pontibacter sp. JAM-7]|uniref:hypothetical protein n=1 Tax=Pontibacter sp. JAM-7 TaxID=3366581 RepID=UPI003AF65F7F
MTTDRHPDIEIYIKHCSLEQIEAWLKARAEQLTTGKTQGTICHYQAIFAGQSVPVMVNEKVVGKAWTSVWFDADCTPWATDLDCAQDAAQALATQIRCIASGWQEGDDPDEWWKVENDETTQIQWHTN